MPRYFFDYTCDGRTAVDQDGLELTGNSEVRIAALEAFLDLLRESLPTEPTREVSISVRDEAGQIVFRAVLSLNGLT